MTNAAMSRFPKIWMGDGVPRGVLSKGEEGTVILLAERIEFEGPERRTIVTDIRSVGLEEIPGHFGAQRIRVAHEVASGVEHLFFFAAYNLPKSQARLRELADAMTSLYGSASGAGVHQQEAAAELAAERGRSRAYAARTKWIGVALVAVGLLNTLISSGAGSSSTAANVSAIGAIVVGVILILVGSLQGRDRT